MMVRCGCKQHDDCNGGGGVMAMAMVMVVVVTMRR